MRLHSRLALGLRILTPLFVVFALTAAAATAGGFFRIVYVDTSNWTQYDTWVDISSAYKITGWHIETAFCLKPHAKHEYDIRFQSPEFGAQVRVRAEIKLHSCNSGTHTVVSSSENLDLKERGARVFAHVSEERPNVFKMSTESRKL